MIKMIVCSDGYGGVGLNNKLPWGGSYPEDLKYFKEQTEGGVVIMGRKTYESLPMYPKGLPQRYNYVVTSDGCGMQDEGYIKISMDRLLSCIKNGDTIFNHKEVWVIGGKSIYLQLLPFVEEIHHTIITGEYECDTFMDITQWTETGDWELKETKVLSDKAKVYIWRRL